MRLINLAATLTCVAITSPAFGGLVIGLYHRPTTDPDERAALWQECAEAGVTDLFVETFYHGFTIYPSNAERTFQERPDLEGHDLLGDYIREGHDHGIRVHAWLEMLLWGPDYDAHPEIPRNQYADTHPDWRVADADGKTTRQFFATPGNNEVANLVTLLCLEVAHQHPEIDGLHLDEMRYPGGGDFTYDASALNAFMAQGHPDPRQDRSDENLAAWRTFCENRLTSLVRQISIVTKGIHGDSIRLSAAVYPTASQEAQSDLKYQNWRAWLENGSLDAIVPKCFDGDLAQVTADARIAVSASVHLASCWVGLAYRPGGQHPPVAEQLAAVGEMPSQGVVWLSAGWLAQDPASLRTIGAWVRARSGSPEAGAN
jgi:uncharacterized lipoprotein YddW (UPF0748 family)